MRLAEELGAAVHLTDSLTGRSLADTQADARRYCEDNSERYLLPFGLKSSRGELYFDLFREAILEAIPAGMSAPRRLWLVGGSGFLFDVLSSIWPETLLLIVQVKIASQPRRCDTHYSMAPVNVLLPRWASASGQTSSRASAASSS